MHAEAQFIDMTVARARAASMALFPTGRGSRFSNCAMLIRERAYFTYSYIYEGKRLYTAGYVNMIFGCVTHVAGSYATSKEAWQAIDAYVANNATE